MKKGAACLDVSNCGFCVGQITLNWDTARLNGAPDCCLPDNSN